MIGIPGPARSLGASHVRTEWTLWAGRTHTASVWSLRGWTDGRTESVIPGAAGSLITHTTGQQQG